MPLVLIDLLEGRTPTQLETLADTVQEVMERDFAAPPGDRYQIITQHRPGELRIGASGLPLRRSDDVVLLRIVQQGRSEEQKTRTYRALAERLQDRCGIDPQDLVITVVQNTRADWSFGNGSAQFLTGELA
ncbi:tautomerase family protein [Amycolatopsis sp. CA-161197]|uniref:tautomerase family protein n=1 Tax=Amycolatopsis sp. CA-161197 TaxID=3239922 RepID=UPI003D8F83AE